MSDVFARFATRAGRLVGRRLRRFLMANPRLSVWLGLPVTVIDRFQTPGDTLLTAAVCREVKKRYPRLRINCITHNAHLLTHDPNIDTLNGPETFLSVDSWYLQLIDARDATTNVLRPTLAQFGISDYEYRAHCYLTGEELARAKDRVAGLPRPFISVNMMTRNDEVKMWPQDYWAQLLPELKKLGTIVQMGDDREPPFEGAVRLAGTLGIRDAIATMGQMDLHIGPDSFLMHAANGVDVPAVIIYGGARPPACLGYALNSNLAVDIECSPCWIHDSRGEKCPYEIKCMRMISPQTVLQAVRDKLSSTTSHAL